MSFSINHSNNNQLVFKEKYKTNRRNLLGSGSSGHVYLVKEILTKKKFAMKIMPISSAVSVNEIQLLIELRSIFIVQYIESFPENLSNFIILEYCEGGDLANQIRRMKELGRIFDEKLIYNWSWQMIHGMDYLHSNRIIHRDIKPKNVLLKATGEVKLGDFSNSKKFTEDTTSLIKSYNGTFNYMSPEMISNQLYSYNTDCWSTGCTIYELITFEIFFDPSLNNNIEIETKLNELITLDVLKKLLILMLNLDLNLRSNSRELVNLIKDELPFTIDNNFFDNRSQNGSADSIEDVCNVLQSVPKIEKKCLNNKKIIAITVFPIFLALVIAIMIYFYVSSTNKIELLNYKQIIGNNYYVKSLVVLPDYTLASGSWNEILIWNLTDGSYLRRLNSSDGFVNFLIVSEEDGSIISADGMNDYGEVSNWNATSGQLIKMFGKKQDIRHASYVNCLASLEGNKLASGSSDYEIFIWDVITGSWLKKLTGHSDRVTSLARLEDFQLASSSIDKTIIIWDIVAGKSVKTLKGHTNFVLSVLSLPNKKLATGSGDESIKIWDTQTGSLIDSLAENSDVNSLILLKDNITLASASNGVVKLWDLNSRKQIATFEGHNGSVYCLSIVDDRLVSGSDQSIIFWQYKISKPNIFNWLINLFKK